MRRLTREDDQHMAQALWTVEFVDEANIHQIKWLTINSLACCDGNIARELQH